MKKCSNTTTIVLMAISILLLIASQLFWLKSEYNERRRSFYNNSDLLFKETVREYEDKILSKEIANVLAQNEKKTEQQRNNSTLSKPITKNTSPKEPSNKLERLKKGDIKSVSVFKIKDSTKLDSVKKAFFTQADSVKLYNDSISLEKSTIIIRSSRSYFDVDSIESLKKIISQLNKVNFQNEARQDSLRPHRRRFNFQSAHKDTIALAFTQRIEQMGYPVAFTVTKDTIPYDTLTPRQRAWSDMHRKLRTSQDSIFVNGVKVLNPELISSFSMASNTIFRAEPNNLEPFLLSKLKNNFLFSIFLLLLTTVTFIIIFRNLNKQERLNSIKNELISNVTHELKTPLATLSVALEAMQQFGATAKPETTKEYLEISKNEVNRLALMIDNILKASLLENHAINIQPKSLNFDEMVRSISKSWQPRFQTQKGSLCFEVIGTDFLIEADEVHLSSIINNLIDNALKYAKEVPTVKLTLTSKDDHVVLKVKDSGIGIPKEFQSQVFEKFFRVPTDDRHNVKGYGLGLNFVKHILDLHGGQIKLNSSTEGSEFILTFKKKL